LLEIDSNSLKSEIKKAYRRKAEKYHPDKIKTRDKAKVDYALKRMKELNQAKDILLNPEKRVLYDSILEQQIADYSSFSYLSFTTITKLYRLTRLCKELDNQGFDAKKPKRLLKQAKMAVKDEDFQYALEVINDGIEWIEGNYPEVIYIQRQTEEKAQKEIDKDLPSFDFFRRKAGPTPSGQQDSASNKERPSECPKCFNPIQEDQDYCYYCGFSFD
jgi:curved DNA-binding protein CbpA